MLISRRTVIAAGATIFAWPSRGRATLSSATTLRYVPEFDLRGLDPIVDTGLTTLQHGYMIYDTLFAMDSAMRPKPQMVSVHDESPDGLVHEFGLRPGLLFHDATPVLSRDCVASIRRWAARDVMGKVLLARGASLEIVDECRFRLLLRLPFPMLLHALAKISASPCFIMRAHDAETDPYRPVTTSVGSGPFRFLAEQHIPGAVAVYQRNEAYVPRPEPSNGYSGGKRAMVDRVEWRFLPDAATRAAALLTGEIDIVASVPSDLVPALRRNADIRVQALDRQGWMLYIRPNHLFPPFNDIRARQALAHLVDQADYSALASGESGAGQLECSFLADRATPAGTGFCAAYQPDLDQARALMASAGYDGSPVVVLDPTDNPLLSSVTSLTVSQLRKIGVTVQTVSGDLASVMARRSSRARPDKGGWNLFHGRSMSVEMANPLTNFPLASPCGLDRTLGWFGWPCAPRLEALRRDWADAVDEAARQRLAVQLQQEAALALPFIPLGRLHIPTIHRARVGGLIDMPVLVFWGATVAAN